MHIHQNSTFNSNRYLLKYKNKIIDEYLKQPFIISYSNKYLTLGSDI